MKKNKFAPLLILFLTISSSSCSTSSSDKPYTFTNGDFELGTLSNWTISGDAFNDTCVLISDSNKDKIHVEGNFYLSGESVGNEAVGTLKSTSFKLKGNGKISFLIGGGANPDLVYVSIHKDDTGEEITRISNKFFNHEVPNNRMYRIVVDLKEYIGEQLYVQLNDNDSSNSGYNYIMVDDFEISSSLNEDDGTLLSDARNYTLKYKDTVNDRYRHTYHLMPTIGWMNDPNGFVYYDGYYHLFYQHNPYSSSWDTMYWGHAISKDLIKWTDASIALAPDKSYDKNGVFSGGAVVDGDKMHLLYTAVGETGVQQQALATSFDGVSFTKRNMNPVIDSSMRLNSRITDFRDPYLFVKDDVYYALIGGKLEGEGGQLLLYSSSDLLNWKTIGSIYSSTITGSGMFECPNYAYMDGKDIIITSPQSIRDADKASYQNIHSVTYQIGNLDFENGIFTNDNGVDYMEEFDKGFDFYATQIYQEEDRTIMLAWMNMWSRSYPSAIDGYAGEVTLPRELELKDNHIYQKPIQEIQNYYQNETILNEIESNNNEIKLDINGDKIHLNVEIDVLNLNGGKAGFKLLQSENESTNIYYDDFLGMVVFDRRNSGVDIDSFDDDGELNVRYARIEPIDNKIKFEIFVDVSSVELFINDGYYTMSGLVFPTEAGKDISFFTEGGSAHLTSGVFHDIEVN